MHYNEICEVSVLELCPNAVDGISKTHKTGNLQHTFYHFSFVDVTLPVDTLFDVIHSAMGDRKVPRSGRCT